MKSKYRTLSAGPAVDAAVRSVVARLMLEFANTGKGEPGSIAHISPESGGYLKRERVEPPAAGTDSGGAVVAVIL